MLASRYGALLGVSLTPVLLLDVIRCRMDEYELVIDIALLLWLLWSVGMSMLLLRRRALPKVPILPLADLNRDSVCRARGENLDMALGFGHAWLVLNRFMGVISSCRLLLSSTERCLACTHGSLTPGSWWTPVGLPFSLSLVVIFGQCLLSVGIDAENWGYFRHPYQLITSSLKLVIYFTQSAIQVLEAFRVAIEMFRQTWGNAPRVDL
ncbi:hypothetical protein GYMLUDRAFT_935255 [Collybiopsis luxurians FD-317 M1]|nr:hypothetical protein GYMLUDRAFT_935255 [Collybiopsis luxurians FD-317 M1]